MSGTLRVHLRKAIGLDSADLNGKSDPYVLLDSGSCQAKSNVKPKTINPVWNEEHEFQGTLADFVNSGLVLRVFDCDNPLRPDKDESLGELTVSLEMLRLDDSYEFIEPLPTKGKIHFGVAWEPPAPEEEASSGLVCGDERVIIGGKTLLLRESFSKESKEVLKLPVGTRVQLHEVREMEDGFRAHVLVVGVPKEYAHLPSYQNALGNAKGWITAMHKDGRKRLAKRHLKLDAAQRRAQVELWNRRLTADRALTTNKKAAIASPGFAHELTDCRRGIAFAYGGLHPGTLHAHGALVKTHQVHYSVGAAGTYLMHVGLRQKEAILPGSPFVLTVKPGPAHALCSDLPAEQLPLQTMVGTRGTLLIPLADEMSNQCREGGAPLRVALDTKKVVATLEDQDDGTYLISWNGETAGTFNMSLTIDGVHIRGSPAPLTMLAAELDVDQCEFVAQQNAVAGEAETIKLVCRDPFQNDAGTLLELRFGLILVPLPSNEKHMAMRTEKPSTKHAAEADGEKKSWKLNKEERANLIKTSACCESCSRSMGNDVHPCPCATQSLRTPSCMCVLPQYLQLPSKARGRRPPFR